LANDVDEVNQYARTHSKRRPRIVFDRLSRNLAFIATLMDSGVEFVATDNPHANKLTQHVAWL
jgi:hypothetical protein